MSCSRNEVSPHYKRVCIALIHNRRLIGASGDGDAKIFRSVSVRPTLLGLKLTTCVLKIELFFINSILYVKKLFQLCIEFSI